MTKIFELFANSIYRMHEKTGGSQTSFISSAIKKCCKSFLLLCEETMNLKNRKSPLKEIFRDPNLINEA
jgi:hypothetical protein